MNRLVALALLLAPLFVLAESAATKKPPRIICIPPKGTVQKMVRPTYPVEAKKEGIFGKVLMQVTINKEGRPTAIRVIKGHPILAEAVRRVLPQWRWKPLLLNGEAVEVETTITVNFEPGRP